MGDIPFMAIFNEDLFGTPKGDTAICPKCSKSHKIIWGKTVMPDGTKKKCKMLGGVKCSDGNDYLVVVGGKLIRHE